MEKDPQMALELYLELFHVPFAARLFSVQVDSTDRLCCAKGVFMRIYHSASPSAGGSWEATAPSWPQETRIIGPIPKPRVGPGWYP